MMIVGLTGSIGMGKSTAAKMLRQMGVPVYDADANVHAVQAKGGAALPAIEAAFPGVVKDGVLDRQALGARVFGNKPALRQLEAIVHPLVAQQQRLFVKQAARRPHRGDSDFREPGWSGRSSCGFRGRYAPVLLRPADSAGRWRSSPCRS